MKWTIFESDSFSGNNFWIVGFSFLLFRKFILRVKICEMKKIFELCFQTLRKPKQFLVKETLKFYEAQWNTTQLANL